MSRSTLPLLDDSLYPQVWEQQTFETPRSLLLALLENRLELEPKAFTKQLLGNNIYQDWINATVFGRYIQRSFAAFYQQSEDSFNMDMPALFRNELMRHAQYLPMGQTLLLAGDIPKKARIEKLFSTTLNPATATVDAQKIKQRALQTGRRNNQNLIINLISIVGKSVIGFPIRHNKRTSERTRNEVLILDFNDLRLVNEDIINSNFERSVIEEATVLRYYELR